MSKIDWRVRVDNWRLVLRWRPIKIIRLLVWLSLYCFWIHNCKWLWFFIIYLNTPTLKARTVDARFETRFVLMCTFIILTLFNHNPEFCKTSLRCVSRSGWTDNGIITNNIIVDLWKAEGSFSEQVRNTKWLALLLGAFWVMMIVTFNGPF